jgi:uncharacterized protein YecT (DUF1311 family)
MSKALSRLFEVRHILCHELPRARVYHRKEVESFLLAATQFADAIMLTLSRLISDNWGMTTVEMNEKADQALKKSEAELALVTKAILNQSMRPRHLKLWQKEEKAWSVYRHTQCEFAADAAYGGSLSGWLRIYEAHLLTCDRAKYLRSRYLSADEDQ